MSWCVWYMYAFFRVWVWAHTQGIAYMWRLENNLNICPGLPILWDKVFCCSPLSTQASRAPIFQGSFLPTSYPAVEALRLQTHGTRPSLCGIWGLQLRLSCMYSKCLTYRTTFSTTICFQLAWCLWVLFV